MTSEPTITFTRAEFIAYTQRIQDLALMGAFIYLPGMKQGEPLPANCDKLFPSYQPDEPHHEGTGSIPPFHRYEEYTPDETTEIVSCYLLKGNMDDLGAALGRSANALYRHVHLQRKIQGEEKIPYRGYGKRHCRARYSNDSGRYLAKDL